MANYYESSIRSASASFRKFTHHSTFRFDLGVKDLIVEWKKLFSTKYLKEDFVAGTTVACIAIPLSLAIALASGVEPATGLITAIVASIVCAFFGGTPLAVSGPAAAMAVLISSTVQEFGLTGLLFVGLGSGLLQILSGVFRLGQLIRYFPTPVIAGFTAGIGAIIFIGQLPRALGLPAPDQSHVLQVLLHINNLFDQTHYGALFLAVFTVASTFILPRFFPRLPAPLIAVSAASLISILFSMNVPIIGKIPQSLPLPRFPALPEIGILRLVWSTLIVFTLASLETLLSSSAVDKLTKGKQHDPDQELIGQGMGNVASSLFGGIPVTGVIARSALNIQAGAKTRRSAIFHAMILIASVYWLSPVLSQIPIAVLSGVLFSVALRMLHPREFLHLWKSSRIEAITYLVTFVAIILVDLIAGVQAGIITALIIAAFQFGQLKYTIHGFDKKGPTLLTFSGILTFFSASKFKKIQSDLLKLDPKMGVIIDMTHLRSIDTSGCQLLIEFLTFMKENNIQFVLKNASVQMKEILISMGHVDWVGNQFATYETDIHRILGQPTEFAGIDRVMYGVERFRNEMKTTYGPLFKELGQKQTPHTLFITCCDSRIDPNLITTTDPGELFIVRNVGNIIPPCGKDDTPAEGAAIEFAVGVLGVKEIIICAHSECGAMKEVLNKNIFSDEKTTALPSIARWLHQIREVSEQVIPGSSLKQITEMNVVLQLKNIMTYPIVRERMKQKGLRLHAWYFDIANSELEEWDDHLAQFMQMDKKRSAPRPMVMTQTL